MQIFIDTISKFFTQLIPNAAYPLACGIHFRRACRPRVFYFCFRGSNRNAPTWCWASRWSLCVPAGVAAAVPNRWEWVVGPRAHADDCYQLFYLWPHHPKETVSLSLDSRSLFDWPFEEREEINLSKSANSSNQLCRSSMNLSIICE